MELITMIGEIEYARSSLEDLHSHPFELRVKLKEALVDMAIAKARKVVNGSTGRVWFVLSAESKMNQIKI